MFQPRAILFEQLDRRRYLHLLHAGHSAAPYVQLVADLDFPEHNLEVIITWRDYRSRNIGYAKARSSLFAERTGWRRSRSAEGPDLQYTFLRETSGRCVTAPGAR